MIKISLHQIQTNTTIPELILQYATDLSVLSAHSFHPTVLAQSHKIIHLKIPEHNAG